MTKEFVINWHITEACNYSCQFCFAQWANKDRCDLIKADDLTIALIDQLKTTFDAEFSQKWGFDSLRINFAGGEPLLYADKLLVLAAYCQSQGIATSLITNGVYLLEKAISLKNFNMVGISIDSLDKAKNLEIGRHNRQAEVLDVAALQAYLQKEKQLHPALDIKVNTVVNSVNHDENMTDFIEGIAPSRWKVFKMLPVVTDALSVTDAQYQSYLDRHENLKTKLVSEDNSEMTASYLMIDPMGRFYSNAGAIDHKSYRYSSKILEVGMMSALENIDFNLETFRARY